MRFKIPTEPDPTEIEGTLITQVSGDTYSVSIVETTQGTFCLILCIGLYGEGGEIVFWSDNKADLRRRLSLWLIEFDADVIASTNEEFVEHCLLDFRTVFGTICGTICGSDLTHLERDK